MSLTLTRLMIYSKYSEKQVLSEREQAMDELKKQIIESTGLTDGKAQNVINMVASFLKKRLPVPIPSQIDVVLAGADVRHQISRLFDAIDAPVKSGDSEVVKLILAQGVNPNLRNSVG